ncbi:MAG TPA: hypothetical protein VN721_09860 [Flavipsychrobacter sp.]|nr:hypothetical protein [Flavipsychrobacter sp.]
MKKLLLAVVLGVLCLNVYADTVDTTLTEKNIKDKILSDIQENLSIKNKAVDSTISRLDIKVGKLDSLIKITGNPKERVDKLMERVQVLEDKQKALEQNELNIYQANYQSALINLASMDREIKPLLLFHTTRDFFNTLTETSNPVNYEGFQSGFEKFKVYVDKYKDHDATLGAVSDIISSTGNISFGIPLVGAYSQLLFSGMAKYVNSIGHKKRALKKEAEKMFAITAKLSQFTTDKNMIEHEWDGITQSLSEMEVYYDSALNRNLRMVNIDRDDFNNEFTRQSDANARYLYLTILRDKAAKYVLDMKGKDPKNWKENIYYQLMDVQSLKMKYGDITYRIRQHIDKYDVLISKYKADPQIGDHVAKLEVKLNQLKETFDSAFEPSEYVHTATRMYKVM